LLFIDEPPFTILRLRSFIRSFCLIPHQLSLATTKEQLARCNGLPRNRDKPQKTNQQKPAQISAIKRPIKPWFLKLQATNLKLRCQPFIHAMHIKYIAITVPWIENLLHYKHRKWVVNRCDGFT
jgi:hypothetical protein